MKLSTYLMIGAFAVGLVSCVGVTLWVNSMMFKPATTVELSGEPVESPVENFSVVEFSAPYSGRYARHTNVQRYSIYNLPVQASIIESDSISQPVLTTYPVLGDMVSVSVANDTLFISYSPKQMPSAEDEFIKYVNTIDVPVTVTVPRGMLKSVIGHEYAEFDTIPADVNFTLVKE